MVYVFSRYLSRQSHADQREAQLGPSNFRPWRLPLVLLLLLASSANDGIALVPVPPPQVVLVLDMSGSMLFPICSTCTSKLEVLQEAVEIFINTWKQFDPDEDQIGVVYFRNTASPFTFASNGASLAPVCTTPQSCPDADDANDDVRNQQTTLSALTAMGSGLVAGIDTLQPPLSRNRHIILFTDGIQNVAPLV